MTVNALILCQIYLTDIIPWLCSSIHMWCDRQVTKISTKIGVSDCFKLTSEMGGLFSLLKTFRKKKAPFLWFISF